MRYLTLLGILLSVQGWTCVVRAAEPLPPPTGPVLLTLSGKIEQTNVGHEAQFDRQMLEALGHASFTTGHSLSNKPQLFEGVPLRAVLDRVGVSGTTMLASALNRYRVSIPLEDLKYDPLIAMRADGQELKLRDKGPLWIVYPRDSHSALQTQTFDSRWIWQLNKLDVE